jgi:hypothetical protein
MRLHERKGTVLRCTGPGPFARTTVRANARIAQWQNDDDATQWGRDERLEKMTRLGRTGALGVSGSWILAVALGSGACSTPGQGGAFDEARTSEQRQPLAGGSVTNAYGLVELPGVPGCTGSMIAPNTLLTAAHCFDDWNVPTQSTISINLSYFDPEQGKRGVFSGQATLNKHPSYAGWESGYDLALIIIPDRFTDTDYHDYKRLLSPLAGTNLPESQRFYGRGYYTADTSVPNDGLLRTHSLTVETDYTSNWYITTDNGDGIRTCKGDSGGPLNVVAVTPSGLQYELVSGILNGSDKSFSSICASQNPWLGDNSHFTRPSGFVSWIESTIGRSCTVFQPVANWPYLRCYDLDFVEDVPFESYEQDEEVAMVAVIDPIAM